MNCPDVFLFSPLPGEMESNLTGAYFSVGLKLLKPPTIVNYYFLVPRNHKPNQTTME